MNERGYHNIHAGNDAVFRRPAGGNSRDYGRELFGDATPLNGRGNLDTSAGIAAQGPAALPQHGR